MKRRPPLVSGPTLRAQLRERYADFEARHSGSHGRRIVAKLDAGEPVVLAGWQLNRYGLPQVRHGVHAFYQIDSDGRVTKVDRGTNGG